MTVFENRKKIHGLKDSYLSLHVQPILATKIPHRGVAKSVGLSKDSHELFDGEGGELKWSCKKKDAISNLRRMAVKYATFFLRI